jgi:VIT1/CCC1 family predicted Fe2+/Mn2+ transporter
MTDPTPPSSPESVAPPKRFLEPNERIAEVLFGLIMVLTFTGSLSVAEAGRDDVRAMLVGALGCNLAWGIIDAILYLMACLSDQARGIRALRDLRGAGTPEEARRVIGDALPPLVAATLSAPEYESVRHKLLQLPEQRARPRLRKNEWLAALGVFLWVFLTTFPVATPFIFMSNLGAAMRVSNAIAIVLLFVTGYAYGRVTEYHPWLTGIAMVVMGAVLAGITLALGG